MYPFLGFDIRLFFYRDIMAKMAPSSLTSYDIYLYETGNAVAAYIVSDKSVTAQQALVFKVQELST